MKILSMLFLLVVLTLSASAAADKISIINDLSTGDRLFNEGNAAQRAGQLYRAITLYERAIRANPKDAEAYLSMGLVYTKLKNYAKAQDCLLKAISLEPNSFAANEQLGVVYAEQNKLSEAARAYENASKQKMTPADRQLHENNLASLHQREKKDHGKKRRDTRRQDH